MERQGLSAAPRAEPLRGGDEVLRDEVGAMLALDRLRAVARQDQNARGEARGPPPLDVPDRIAAQDALGGGPTGLSRRLLEKSRPRLPAAAFPRILDLGPVGMVRAAVNAVEH